MDDAAVTAPSEGEARRLSAPAIGDASGALVLDCVVEPMTVLGSLGVAFARALSGRALSQLGGHLGLSRVQDVARSLSAIDAKVNILLSRPHMENLRRGVVLLREAARQDDQAEVSRRLRVAEDCLVVAATDGELGSTIGRRRPC